MAKKISIDNERKELIISLQKAVQSARLNFLIGSGCSCPALPVLGNIEKEVQGKIDANKSDEAEKLIFNFLKPFVDSTIKLIDNSVDDGHTKTYGNYKSLLNAISKILFERKSTILLKQASIFSTNYDMFIEKVAEQHLDSLIVNDGFKRSPSMKNIFRFSITEFFNSVYNTGNLYDYKVQIPSVNLIKLHGSLSWQSDSKGIFYSLEYLKTSQEKDVKLSVTSPMAEIKKFNKQFSIILPQKDKFKDALLNQTYYDLLRIYANELDKENTLFIAEGFSFADEHILEITRRGLRNPTLKLIIFCFKKDEFAGYTDKFNSYNNVDIVYSETGNVDFEKFNSLMYEILPKIESDNSSDSKKDSADE